MAANQIAWLATFLVATPALYVACGGRSETDGYATGSARAGGSGGSINAGGSTMGRGGGAATTGTGGSGGSGATGGGIDDSGAPDGRTPCGTMLNGCTANPQGNTICDLANNRCVQCLADPDCAGQTTNKTCDTRPSGNTRLPADRCVQCIDNTQCPPGATCSTAGTCTTPCGTMTCSANAMGNTVCDLPNNRCVQCLSDGDCASQTTNKTCDLRANMQGLPTGRCIGCLDNSQCAGGSMCIGNTCIAGCSTDTDCLADGGGRTPHCNPTTKVCAQCGSDAHCTSTMAPACGPAGTCVQCTIDTHCATTAGRPFCGLSNTCVQCISDDQCVPPATCNTRGSCGGGGVADGGGRGDSGGTPPISDSGGGTPPAPDSGGGTPPTSDSGGGGG